MSANTADVVRFRALHARDRVLVLPNVWDAASAAIARSLGAEAIATTSAGVSWGGGYPDGNAVPPFVRTAAIAGVKRAAGDLPVSMDFEEGYSADPDEVAEFVSDLRGIGVAGINLEDGNADPALLEAKIRAIKSRLQRDADDIFVNARTDVYLQGDLEGEEALRETIERIRGYAAAGADGIFVPLVIDPQAISEIAASVERPLNVLAVPGVPPAGELSRLGVRRLSAGGRLFERVYGVYREAARAFLERGDGRDLVTASNIGYAEMNRLFAAT